MLDDKRRQDLIEQGAEALADALLSLAIHSEEADDLIDQLIATPKENVRRFKNKLAGLKRSRRFIDWRSSSGHARKLEMLLRDLKAGVSDPLTGIELVAAFFEADDGILGNCDDSNGQVGAVFRYDAKALFLHYACNCTEKENVASVILKLNRKDNYGIRDTLVECAGQCLPESVIRGMIDSFEGLASKQTEDYDRRHFLRLVESLARQIKDAKLFEKTRIASWGELPTAALIDIGRVYLESDDVDTAHSWLKRIPAGETFQAYERDQLLLEIYQKQGDTDKLTELLYQKFRAYHTTDALEALLDVIGHDKRDKIIQDEVALITADESLRESDVAFLISVGLIDEAEAYLLKRAGQLNGYCYNSLLEIAKTMDLENRHLASSLIYRSLLISILERGYTKAYSHGVRYLKKLDKLSSAVSDWKDFEHHDSFKDQIVQAHGRKRSFWSKYEDRASSPPA